MNISTETQSNNLIEVIKWIVVAVLIIMTIVGNYIYQHIMLPIRVITAAIIIALASGIALSTIKGKAMVVFAREARVEIRKIIWPTYRDTFHITLIVLAVTIIMSLILWGLDSILVYIISFVSGL